MTHAKNTPRSPTKERPNMVLLRWNMIHDIPPSRAHDDSKRNGDIHIRSGYVFTNKKTTNKRIKDLVSLPWLYSQVDRDGENTLKYRARERQIYKSHRMARWNPYWRQRVVDPKRQGDSHEKGYQSPPTQMEDACWHVWVFGPGPGQKEGLCYTPGKKRLLYRESKRHMCRHFICFHQSKTTNRRNRGKWFKNCLDELGLLKVSWSFLSCFLKSMLSNYDIEYGSLMFLDSAILTFVFSKGSNSVAD